MSEFNFKSQICTSRSQSERLIALGLKKETADMLIMTYSTEQDIIALPWSESGGWTRGNSIPAWSLHRLIELAYGNWKEDIVPVYLGNSYDMLIGRIEFQVKQEKFNKEYLNGTAED